MSHHHEGETTPGNHGAGPHVVGAMKSGANLVEIVTSTHAPFPVVRAKHVSHVSELGWVTLGLGLQS